MEVTSCNLLTRNLGAFEHFIWSTDQWTPRHFVFVARIEGGSISVDHLHRALRAVQHRHPALRAAIDLDPDGYPRFVPAELPIQLGTVERVADIQWRSEVELQLRNPFHAGQGPLVRVTLVRGESVSELIIAAHHSIGDGISAMFLVRDLLESLEGHALEELPVRPCVEDFIGHEPAAPTGPNPGFSEADPVEIPGTPQVASIDIEPRDVEILQARCREERTTVQGALLAAVLLELRNGPVSRCLAPVSVRHLCPPIADDFGLYIAAGTATLDGHSNSDFWPLARRAREEITNALDPDALRMRAAAMISLMSQKRGPRCIYQDYRRGVNYRAALSNLGRFPLMSRVRQFRVTAIYPVLNIESEPVIAVGTAGGRMGLTLTSHGSPGIELLESIVREVMIKPGGSRV
jgi:hypothetical protein